MHKDTFISFDENILSNRKIHKRRYLSLSYSIKESKSAVRNQAGHNFFLIGKSLEITFVGTS